MVRIQPPPAAGRRRGSHRRAVVLAAALAAAAAALAVASGAADGTLARLTGATSTAAALRAVTLAPLRMVQARLGASRVPDVAIDVKFKHVNELHELRAEALERGSLVASDADFVPAEFTVDGVSQRGKLRLASATADALADERWPLGVQLRGDDHVLGFRRFTLRPPFPDDLLSEGLLQEELRRNDVLAPRVRYVDVSINGKRLGLMVLAEEPSTEMIESLQRRDGPMLRLLPLPPRALKDDDRSYTEPLRPRHVRRSRKLRRHHKTAARLMRGYLQGELAAGDVFDLEVTGRYLALAELWGANGMLERSRLRFYYNPLTARFEPVGSVAALTSPSDAPESVVEHSPFAAALLRDARVRNAFDEALGRIAAAMAEPSFATELAESARERLRTLHRERPLRAAFDADALVRRAARTQARPAPPQVGSAEPAPSAAAAVLPLPPTTTQEVLDRHPFLRWDAAGREFRGAPGRWDVVGSLILPEGAGLSLAPGTVLRFAARQGIIARGPLTFPGTAEEPIVLEGPPSAVRKERWAGVYVIESRRPSRWTHVAVRNTGGFKRRGWFLAGGVVFRKTFVELLDCTLTGNSSDDSLNIVRSSFTITRPTITDAASDAFDGDYVEGSIEGGSIARAGGDAIDVGGSRLRVSGTRISDVRDKAISVGEHSVVTADSLDISHVGIAIASKNGSWARIVDSTIEDVADVALVAYTNRPDYGPGELTAEGNRIARVSLAALAQTGSRIRIDGRDVPSVDAAIDRLYKEGETDR